MVTKQNIRKRVLTHTLSSIPLKRYKESKAFTASGDVRNSSSLQTLPMLVLEGYLFNLDLWPNKKKDNKSRSVR